MPIKTGNVKQSKFATLATATNGAALFTLPSGSMVTNLRGTGTCADAITVSTRPISSSTGSTLGTVTPATAQSGLLTNAAVRVGEPQVISATGYSTGTCTLEIEYA